MKIVIFYSLILILITTNLSLFGQNNSTELINDDSISSILQSKKNDVIIINENNTINIIGQQAYEIYLSITKKIKFKVLNSSGVEQMTKFTLPESFDPSYISHFPKDRNYTNVYSSMKCNYFKATIITKDGEKKDAEIRETIDYIKMVIFEDDRYGNYEKYNYQIENLNIGDEVIIEYNYNIIYNEDIAKLSSFRIFFNNNIFKENYQLTITHHSKLQLDIDYENNATPDSIYNLDNKKVYYWNKDNVYGCINEDGSRPYLSLPYVIFSIKPSMMLYQRTNSFDAQFIPFYSIYSKRREQNHIDIVKSVSNGVRSKQYNEIAKFVKAETEGITNDSLGYLKLMKIKNTIVDDFAFANDINYFKRIDTHKPKMGDYLSNKVIRDICRYDIYVALITELGLNYYTAYICDNRTGEINNDYFAPMFDSDYMFAVLLKNNSIQYLYPKKEQFGYYLNEIPFYFENTKARLIHISDYNNKDNNINEEIRQVLLPSSTLKENIRRNRILVKINLDSLTTIFDARINLFGQYSTLTRGLYLCDQKNETINELYNKKIWELNDKVDVISKETKIISKEFPFPAAVTTKYKFNNLLEVKDDTFSLNMNNWFNHIIYNDFDKTKRQLDFYADFCGKDSYVYYLEFDKNIKLISSLENTNIKNEFGELIISVLQIKPNVVKISSSFIISNAITTVDKIKTVKDIYDKIQKLNNSSLIFKLE